MAPRDVTALARRFRIDINTGTAGAPVWTQLMGVEEFSPAKIDEKIQESTDHEDAGWQGNQRTSVGWKLEITVRRKVSTAGAYDPAQESLKAKRKLMGADALAQVRYYDRATGAEGESGWGIVGWEESSSKQEDLAKAKITITGDGELDDIDSPL